MGTPRSGNIGRLKDAEAEIGRGCHHVFFGMLKGLILLLWLGLLPRAAASERIALRVQGLPSESSTVPAALAEQRVVEEFLKRYPQVELRPAEGLSIQNMNVEASTIMMIAGGIAPDVIRMQFRSSDSYIQQGIVAPLDEYLSEMPEEGREILGSIPSQILPVLRKQGPEGGTHVYGLPLNLMVTGLYYNKEIFRRAGLPDRAPRDWKELEAFARKIKALGPPVEPLYLPSGTAASFGLMNFMRGAGADALKEVGPNQWKASFDSPGALEAFLFYYRLVEIDRLAFRRAKSLSIEEMEDVGMLFRYVGDTVTIDPELWGFGAVPKGPGGRHGSEINASILSVFSGITDPVKKRAAFDYIAFVTGDEADRIRVSTLVELGLANVINPISLRKFGFERYLVMAPPAFEAEFAQALADSRPEPYGRNCNLIYQEMTYPIDQMLLSRSLKQAWLAGDMVAVRAEAQGILERAVNRTNERMIGYVAPEVMVQRRWVASGVVAAIVVSFLVVGRFLVRSFSHSAAMISRPVGQHSIVPWICLFPALLLVFVWSYVPLARGTQLAFLDYKILLPSDFVGLDNFANVLFDATFWNSILATLHFAAWTLTLGFFAPILLAYGLHLIPRQKILYRTLYYLPSVISGTAVFFLWKELFNSDGILNQALRLGGLEATRAWNEDPNLAMLACVIPGIWAGAGPGCLIYLAALKGIPPEQFEASEIDGAGFWSKTRHIVFPGIKPLIIINFIGAVAAAFHGATNILIMTGGGPNGMTEVSSLLIFFEAFSRLRFGPATAMAWIIGSMLLGFTVMQIKRLSRMEFKTTR